MLVRSVSPSCFFFFTRGKQEGLETTCKASRIGDDERAKRNRRGVDSVTTVDRRSSSIVLPYWISKSHSTIVVSRKDTTVLLSFHMIVFSTTLHVTIQWTIVQHTKVDKVPSDIVRHWRRRGQPFNFCHDLVLLRISCEVKLVGVLALFHCE